MRKSIALKIFSIALIIIALMAIVTGVSATYLDRVADETVELSKYYVPIGQKVSWAARHTSAELLAFERLLNLRQSGASDAKQAVQANIMREREAAVAQDIFEAIALVKSGIADTKVDVDKITFTILERELPQIQSAHAEMSQTIARYLKTQAIESGNQAVRSRGLLTEVVARQRAHVSEEIADVSKLIDELVADSAKQALELEQRAARYTWAVTMIAALVGLGLAAYITRILVRPVRILVRGTQAVSAGDLNVQISITSSDEIADLTSSFNTMIEGLKQKEAIRSTFGKYVDPRIVKHLLDENAMAREAERRHMTIFFSDLEGYTKLCEQLTPALAVRFLNRYFNLMSGPIQEAHGIIDKYIGDSIMALWGPPFTDVQGHALLACRTALAQQAKMIEFQHEVPALIEMPNSAPSINMRIGIATGDITFGNVGSDAMKGFTAIGDSVNLASRLESANKIYGTSILIAESTWEEAGTAIEGRPLDMIRVVGKNEPVRIFELTGLAGTTSVADLEFFSVYAEALDRFRAGTVGLARQMFEECHRLRPDDRAAMLFLERIDTIERVGLPDSWDGVWTLTSK
ncbi:MAG: adenylate/guanylate cyclase domain-containing protein [Betaproteobacteria bacterium]